MIKKFLPCNFMRASLCLFLAIKWFQKRVHRNDKKYYLAPLWERPRLFHYLLLLPRIFFRPVHIELSRPEFCSKLVRIRGGEGGLGKF